MSLATVAERRDLQTKLLHESPESRAPVLQHRIQIHVRTAAPDGELDRLVAEIRRHAQDVFQGSVLE